MVSAEIRVLTFEEVEQLVGWAADEGWNPGSADAAAFQAADPQGFIGCLVDGRLAAGISAVSYGGFGFIGLYICHPDFRGRGLGRKVWDAGMAHLGDAVIGLDGVFEQQDNYRRMGFIPHYRTFRWSAANACASRAVQHTVSRAGPDHAAEITAFDRRFFPVERAPFLQTWLAPPRQVMVSRNGGQVDGYAVLRHCLDGCKIGPLFATSEAVALGLLNACLEQLAGTAVHVDVPEYQRAFSTHLAASGFERGFMTARMYRGAPPAMEADGVFAITTLELG
ncbi:GNAT family N-acetyltransferase [Rhizobium sp. SL42]|uniref:GNAT family N-acetyltransferase n=1 Tax=Rhizobium sp. SL42 TaxID=2806346 RepID=UPI001F36C450|nr:GNAT family N-acetyltransferase [Rhizobium sp. SL42]UJW74887.1 GNAT family N-acetyltransferase [Rhizobium sp. SL42]